MIMLKGYCWHKLEEIIGNLLESPEINLTSCGNVFPACCELLSEFIILISRSALSLFLSEVFIINPGADLSPTIIVKKLTKYHNVGTAVYCQSRNNKPSSPTFIHTTILQLIASKIITLSFDDKAKNPR